MWTIHPVSIDHYENFPVASVLCPPALRPAVVAIYHYARTADDLADEGDAAPAQRLSDLQAYRADLIATREPGVVSLRWPQVFGPLARVRQRHALPEPLLLDLISAFSQDVVQHRYATRVELLDYCARSAHPIGRLLLHLYGVGDAASLRQSDAICSALQLANFWQDLSVDAARDRLYVPGADAERHGVSEGQLLQRADSAAVRRLVAELVGWARERMLAGAPLVHTLPGRAGWELRLVVQGGLRILRRIEAVGCDTLRTRPTLGWSDVPAVAWHALGMSARAGLSARESI
jgi:squalene synthase HpnC